MTKARDRVIAHVRQQIKFYEGRGPEQDLVVSELKLVLMVLEKETKW